MSTPQELHRSAMDFAAQGFMAQMRSAPQDAVSLFEQALGLELAAIAELPELVEPTYSVLHRSAGWMAIHCRQFRQAEQLACRALAGNPPADVADELRDLLEQSNFHRHLNWNDVAIGQQEIRMNLVGRAVASGVTNLSCLLPRMEYMQKVLHRTTQRMLDLSYRARVPKHIREHYPIFASAPRSGSFAISLRLGHPAAAAPFPGFVGPVDVIGEFIDMMAIINDGDMGAVERRIPDPAYRNNFVGLAKTLAPDGKDIRQVGFAANAGGDTRTVALTKPGSQIRPPGAVTSPDASDRIEVTGMLRYADASGRSGNRIKIIETGGQTHDIEVPPGMMDDIVRPMWNSSVTVAGTRRARQKNIRLYDIRQSEPVTGRVPGPVEGSTGLLLWPPD